VPEQHPAGEQVIVEIRGLRSDAPFNVRLKRWLKIGLRAFDLRCVRLQAVPAWTDDTAGRSPAIREAGAINGQPLEESKA
jgi:hypothetical protein